MAQRRMFSKLITDSDMFLEMPVTAQNLYFHLNLHADDDGFLGNAKTVRRMVGANEDDLKILQAKGFILIFPDGVTVIRDWHIHNFIRKDRYRETIYKHDKGQLKVNDNKQYELTNPVTPAIESPLPHVNTTNGQPMVNQRYTSGQPAVNQRSTQVRLGKDRLGNNKYSAFKNAPVTKNEQLEKEFDELWKQYPKKKGKQQALNHYKAWRKKSVKHTKEYMQEKLDLYNQYIQENHTDQQYILNGSTWFNGRFEDELDIKQTTEPHGGFDDSMFPPTNDTDFDDSNLPF